jgi:hypothetical protein
MLYEDKFGVLWDEQDINRLKPSRIDALGLHQYVIDDRELCD